MEELKKVTQVGMPLLGIDARTLCQIHSRILWAKADNKAASDKLLALLSGLPVNRDLWVQISEHLADVESHLQNALNRFIEDAN